MQGAAPWGGGGGGGGAAYYRIYCFFKRKIVRLGSKMDHISDNLAFSPREKNIWGEQKAPGRARSL